MKKFLFIAIAIAIMFSGCETPKASHYPYAYKVEEVCHDGTVYLKFGQSRASWGAVKTPLETCK